MRLHGFVQGLPALRFLDLRELVLLAIKPPELPLEFTPTGKPLRCQRSVLDRRQHRAARLAHMLAVTKLARPRQRIQLRERLFERPLARPQLQHAHARCVDQDGTARQRHQFAMRRGVPPTRIPLAHVLGRLSLLAAQRIDERRLAHARHAEQGDARARHQPRRECLEPRAIARAQRHHGHAGCGELRLGDHRVQVVGEVRLVEHDHRLRPALPRRSDVALDAARVVVIVESRHHEHRVDVRRDDLGFRRLAHGAPHEHATARQHRHDRRGPIALGRAHGDPIAHRGKQRAIVRLVTEPPGDFRRALLAIVDAIAPAVLAHDARGGQAIGAVGFKLSLESLVPAQMCQ